MRRSPQRIDISQVARPEHKQLDKNMQSQQIDELLVCWGKSRYETSGQGEGWEDLHEVLVCAVGAEGEAIQLERLRAWIYSFC